MKKTVKLLSLLIVISVLFSACAQGVGEVANVIADGIKENNTVENAVSNMEAANVPTADNTVDQLSASNKNNGIPEIGIYREGVALVKYDGEIPYELAPDKMAAYSIYPVYDWDGEDYIMQGNKGKIFPIASRHKFYTAVVDII